MLSYKIKPGVRVKFEGKDWMVVSSAGGGLWWLQHGSQIVQAHRKDLSNASVS